MTPAGRQPLNRERVLRAAMEYIDEEGVAALSMRKLGATLGVEAMSLYNHIPNKNALLDGVVELLLRELEIPRREGAWESRIKEGYRRFRRLGLEHPNVFPLLITRPPRTPDGLWLFEEYLKTMIEADFDEYSSLHTFRVLTNYTVGYTMAEIRGFALEPDGDLRRDGDHHEKFPYINSIAPLFESVNHDEEFDFGLDLILSGLEKRRDGNR